MEQTMKNITKIVLISLYSSLIYAESNPTNYLPKLQMPDNNLTFRMIDGYQDYKIVATHFRTDKNELRYVLANKIGYNALKSDSKIMPEGSKIVKIGWSVKKMASFPAALEADKIQRVEYMIKDSKNFDANGDNWGYARFIKKDGKFESWDKGTQGCISCHSTVKKSDYLFTKIQNTFE
jgi:hypothetical protein